MWRTGVECEASPNQKVIKFNFLNFTFFLEHFDNNKKPIYLMENFTQKLKENFIGKINYNHVRKRILKNYLAIKIFKILKLNLLWNFYFKFSALNFYSYSRLGVVRKWCHMKIKNLNFTRFFVPYPLIKSDTFLNSPSKRRQSRTFPNPAIIIINCFSELSNNIQRNPPQKKFPNDQDIKEGRRSQRKNSNKFY